MIDPIACDGLIVSNTFADFTRRASFEDFLAHYQNVPMVGIAISDPRVPSILVDNTQAMRLIMAHLVEHHKCRRIAIIRGPRFHAEAEERYQVYCDLLAEYGLMLESELVLPGEFTLSSGADAIATLIKRNVKLPDAILACNDPMAIGAVQALQALGIRVPEDVAVIGFDDTDDTLTLSPSITTVHQPIYEEGRWAVEELYTRLQGISPSYGDGTPIETTLPGYPCRPFLMRLHILSIK